MLDTPVSERFVAVAERIVVSRVVFARLHDKRVERLVPEAALPFIALARLRERDHPGSAGGRKDVADFAAALRQAEALGLLADFLVENAALLFGSEEAATKVLVPLTSHPRQFETFNRSLAAVAGEIDALRRTCRIICQVGQGEQERGSGFLIGPHLVLTNYHVVTALISEAKPIPGSQQRLRIELDALLRGDGRLENVQAYGVVEAWLVACREAHRDELSGGGTGPKAPWPDRPFELAEKLDFAIIELDGTPGYERGWYDLTEAHMPRPGARFELFQFPLGRPMCHAAGTFARPDVFAYSDQPPRLLHDALTEHGSSGGLCLDSDSKAVALHQADQGHAEDGTVRKVAIPLSLIAEVAGQKVADKIANAPRIATVTAAGAPVLGRKRLQGLVDEMIRGRFKLLFVQCDADPARVTGKLGKTFSAAIVRALLPTGAHSVFEVAANRLTSDAYEAARALVQACGKNLAADPAASSPGARAFTPTDADALASAVLGELAAAAGGSVPWLLIDELDRFPIRNETTTASFFDVLCRRAVTESELRIVMIGPAAIPSGFAGLETRTEVLHDHITAADVEAWITRRFRVLAPLLPEHGRILAAVIGSMPGGSGSGSDPGRTQATAEALLRHWVPFLQAPPDGRPS
jgi:S1-C subfamily serine protease